MFFQLLPAQERLVGPDENPNARPQPVRVQPKGLRQAPDLLQLPFVDNFVPKKPWPDEQLWTTNGVYVNDHYPLNMPTLGVATFDPLDANGRLYPGLTGSASPADTLTSLPINLSGTANVVLSFFFQAGGLADMPGPNDLLMLEFYAPDTGEWSRVWSAAVNQADSSVAEFSAGGALVVHKFDTINSRFIYRALEVGPEYLQSGFKFRFTNLVTLVVNVNAPGRANYADAWHLSFVYLDKNRNLDDPRLPDVGIAVPQGPVTSVYSSVPAYHLNTTYAQQTLFGTTSNFTLTYRNLGWGTSNVTRRFSIRPLYGSMSAPATYSGGSENIFDFQTQTRVYNDFPPYNYYADDEKEAAFEIRSYLVTDSETSPLRKALRRNDTTTYVQRFHDYYAYDDGSAENGYGLFGNNTDAGRVAVQFESLRADSLRGVYLYFNLAKDSANIRAFKLAVWADNDGVPGALLFSQQVNRPVLRDSLNAYVAYKFAKPLPLARGQIFYVGWIQSSEVFLNIGFDANTLRGDKNYYALSPYSGWYYSIYDGALMMRPIFCKPEDFPDDFVPPPTPAHVTPEDDYLLHPNPASDVVFIRNLSAEENLLPQTAQQRVEVYNMGGRLVLSAYTSDGNFAVSSLPAGVYVVRIFENNMVKASRKIIIAR